MDFLFGESKPYTERELVLLGEWDGWIVALVLVVALVVVGLSVYNYRNLQPLRRRLSLIGLRAVIVLALLSVFFQPAFLEENVAKSTNHVAVLIDTSESMTLPHGDSTRIRLARDFIAEREALWEEIGEDNEIAFFRFGEQLGELPDLAAEPAEIEAATTGPEEKTDILGALREVRQHYRNQDLGGIVLLTDGIDTTSAGRRAGLDGATQALVTEIDAPIISFTSAGDDRLKDVSIHHVAYNNFAFLMNATSLDATVRVHGYDRGELVLRMTENGREVARKTVHITPGQKDYTVTFEFVPKALGKQVFGVSVEDLPDEIYAKNNARQMIINVIRDKIRVLQIVGQPSWDERFLRNHLKQNPNVDLISFFILVNTTSWRPVSAAETALIPFPAQELFEEELGGFDLAIFQNFNYGPFRTRKYLPYIAKFVREGGAFLMVGGPKSFSAGGYYGTPITDVLPVDLPANFGNDPVVDTKPFELELTESGRHHPITRLALDPHTNEQLWGKMEPLEGVNMITRAKSDAVVLATHPTLRDKKGEPMPVVAVREVAEGRSMVVTTDSTWHWSFKAGNEGKDPRHYDAFWASAIRWLIKDPELDLVRVRVLRENVPLGEKARVRVDVFQPDYQPAKDTPVDIVVKRRRSGDGQGEGEEVLRLADQLTDSSGRLELELELESPGIHEVTATAAVVSGRETTGSDLFVMTDTNPEYETVIGDGRLLSALAEASQGAVYPLEVEEPALALREPRVVKVASRRHRELWNVPFVVLVLAALFGLEWSLRRRYGYL